VLYVTFDVLQTTRQIVFLSWVESGGAGRRKERKKNLVGVKDGLHVENVYELEDAGLITATAQGGGGAQCWRYARRGANGVLGC
jgi:hypothetical protein